MPQTIFLQVFKDNEPVLETEVEFISNVSIPDLLGFIASALSCQDDDLAVIDKSEVYIFHQNRWSKIPELSIC